MGESPPQRTSWSNTEDAGVFTSAERTGCWLWLQQSLVQWWAVIHLRECLVTWKRRVNGSSYLGVPWIFMNRHHALPMLISVSLLEFAKHKMLNNMSASFLRKETSKRKRKNRHFTSLYSETTVFKTEHTTPHCFICMWIYMCVSMCTYLCRYMNLCVHITSGFCNEN